MPEARTTRGSVEDVSAEQDFMNLGRWLMENTSDKEARRAACVGTRAPRSHTHGSRSRPTATHCPPAARHSRRRPPPGGSASDSSRRCRAADGAHGAARPGVQGHLARVRQGGHRGPLWPGGRGETPLSRGAQRRRRWRGEASGRWARKELSVAPRRRRSTRLGTTRRSSTSSPTRSSFRCFRSRLCSLASAAPPALHPPAGRGVRVAHSAPPLLPPTRSPRTPRPPAPASGADQLGRLRGARVGGARRSHHRARGEGGPLLRRLRPARRLLQHRLQRLDRRPPPAAASSSPERRRGTRPGIPPAGTIFAVYEKLHPDSKERHAARDAPSETPAHTRRVSHCRHCTEAHPQPPARSSPWPALRRRTRRRRTFCAPAPTSSWRATACTAPPPSWCSASGPTTRARAAARRAFRRSARRVAPRRSLA